MKKIKGISMAVILCGLAISCNRSENCSLVDKNADPQTVKLYGRLFNLLDKGIMVAHQDALVYGRGWYGEPDRSDVKDVAGDYPAVVGCELGDLELGAQWNLDSVSFEAIKHGIRQTAQRGGISTVSWHANNIQTGNSAWDCGQNTVVASVLPGGKLHDSYLAWLDRLGDFFLDLKDDTGNSIPVVFRMYHEHTGDWFWWGWRQCTPNEYKRLWVMTVDYLRNEKQVHNLLYAYSPSAVRSESEFLERYPGDEYVDVIGFDTYVYGQDRQALAEYRQRVENNLRIVTAYASKAHKIPILAETGLEAIPDKTYFTEVVYPLIGKYRVSWVLFWRNAWESDKPHHYYIPTPGHAAADDFRKFVSYPDILLNKDIRTL